MVKIVVESGPLRGRVFPLPSGKPITVGRDTGCSIQIPDRQASRLHFILVPVAAGYVLQDRESRNGTYVNGKKVTHCALQAGDVIRAGGTHLSILGAQGDPLIGKTVAGYQIEQRLGRGGMGTVYRARQISLDRTVALKILSREFCEDEEFVKRFLEEARSAGKLNHPNVVQVFNAGKHEDLFFLSMEYMAGGSLQQLLDREGRLPARRLLPMILDAARALIWAEQQGIVHRDIKPDNLMLGAEERVKIGDFGIAADRRKSKTLYEGGKILGTPVYMAPEQAEGKPVDQRADIYALGATLFTALSGAFPFDGETPVEIILKKVKEEAPPLFKILPDLAPGLAAIVDRMLAREPEKRFQRAQEVYQALSGALANHAEGSQKAEGSWPGARAVFKRPWLLWSGAGLAAALLLGAAIFLTAHRGTAPPVETAAAPSSSPPAAEENEKTPPPAPEAKPASPDAAPSPDAASTAAAAADQSSQQELAAVQEGWKSGKLGFAEALSKLEDFKNRHPEEKWQNAYRQAAGELESARRKEIDRGLSRLRDLVEQKIDPWTQSGRFREAVELIEGFAQEHPLNREVAAQKKKSIEEKAAAEAEKARRQAGELAAAGEFSKARALLIQAMANFWGPLAAALQGEIAAVEVAESDFKTASEKIEAAAAAIPQAVRDLKWENAEKALQVVPPPRHPLLEARRHAIELELALSKKAYQQIQAQLQALHEKKILVPFAWTDEKSAVRSEPRRVVEVAGLAVKLQAKGGAAESVPLPRLDNETLFRLLQPAAAAVAAPDAEAVEGLGLLLLHTAGPCRAWKLLVPAAAEDEKGKAYLQRLKPLVVERLVADLARALEKFNRLVKKEAAAPASEWQEGLDSIESSIKEASVLPGSRELRADLASLYLAFYKQAAAGTGPGRFFHGKVRPSAAPGIVKIAYDFRSEDQLKDFIPAEPGKTVLRIPRKGFLALRGGCRYLAGEPFQNGLRMSGVAAEYNKSAPNVHLIFWTRARDRMPLRSVYPSSPETSEGPSVLLFGLGYFAETGYTYGSVPYLNLPGGAEIHLPANVLLLGRRKIPSHSFDLAETNTLWGARALKGYRGPLNFDIAVTAEQGVSWMLEGEKLSPKKLEDFYGEKAYRGSVTLQTMNQEVLFSFLEFEGQLDPLWVEREASREALEALKKLDPNLSLVNLSEPLENTSRSQVAGWGRAGKLVFRDTFSGKLSPAWEVLHEEASHWSLSKRPGALVITTQACALVGSSTDYKNLFTIDAPKEKAFEVTARILAFTPAREVQQAGLICYDDEDNHVKASLEWARGKRRFVLLREAGGQVKYLESEADPQLTTLWLRLRRQGPLYSCYTSADGEVFTLQAELLWNDGGPKHVGLLAKNSTADAPEIDAAFDFFEVRSLPQAYEGSGKK
ncbi:MAG: protein kinase [Planctomycetes bacterium]|nr:protein kinase [Planctomycetota bacterium]